MDYNKLVLSQVQKTFKLVGSLATEVVFNRIETATFDFSNMETETAPPTNIKLRGIPGKRDTKAKDKVPQNTESMTLLFISQEIGDPTIYSSATFNNKTWKMVAPFIDDGYTTTVTFVKET